MWAAGIMLFELIYGFHPLDKGFSREEMENCLREYTELQFPQVNLNAVKITEQAKHLIEGLCQCQISGRYTAEQALSHPWITRKLDDKLPLTRKQQRDEQAQRQDLEMKMQCALRSIMFFAICQKPKSTNDSEEYRKQLMI
jgi:serine/threonine protein kinase